jgi:poly-gamma-glutamate biosynthesis protein PgsC/CapC
METLALSVGIGLVVSLLFSELFGLASGGLIVPGYIALYMLHPWQLLATLSVAIATYGVVRLLSTFLIVYGRRRTALMILIGYVLGMLVRQTPWLGPQEFTVIGFVIPGLVAAWMDRQGVLQTLSSLVLCSVVVRLILVLAVGMELGS